MHTSDSAFVPSHLQARVRVRQLLQSVAYISERRFTVRPKKRLRTEPYPNAHQVAVGIEAAPDLQFLGIVAFMVQYMNPREPCRTQKEINSNLKSGEIPQLLRRMHNTSCARPGIHRACRPVCTRSSADYDVLRNLRAETDTNAAHVDLC